jgi:hypothetical protein
VTQVSEIVTAASGAVSPKRDMPNAQQQSAVTGPMTTVPDEADPTDRLA